MFQLKREINNPILAPEPSYAWESRGVFNPGIAKRGAEIVMLYRAVGENDCYVSRLGMAKSADGVNFKRSSVRPVFGPSADFDKWATEDPRITQIGSDFFITYVAVSEPILDEGKPVSRFLPLETGTALLRTRDFASFENFGLITPAGSDNKDTVLFPQKINGRYCLLHRPSHWTKEWFGSPFEKYVDENLPCLAEDLPKSSSIWIAWSDDLRVWRDHRPLLWPINETNIKVGPGLPPIETPDGWLIIYHHVEMLSGKNKFSYTARAALLDLNDPHTVKSVLPYDILVPEKDFELESGSGGIVFPTGGYVSDEGVLRVYYGASDRYVGLASGSLGELLSELNKNTTHGYAKK